jgi:hypothetical protein
MKVEIELSDNNEGTSYPYWLIIDPRQMLQLDVHVVASMITGPFMGRDEANDELLRGVRSNRYSGRARVFCHTGYYSGRYRDAIDAARKRQEPQ